MSAGRILATVAFVLSTATAHALDITTCGQIIPSGETGVMLNDLSCPTPVLGCYDCRPDGRGCFPNGASCTTEADCGSGDVACVALPAVAIDLNGRLDLNGHAVTAPSGAAVLCRSKGPCTVTSSAGRGDISGSVIGILMGSGRLDVSNVDVHDNASGIYTPILAVRMRLTNVTANDNGGIGIRTDSLQATDVTANGNGQHGIEARGKLRGSNVATSNNGHTGCIAGRGAKLSGFTATGNGIVAMPPGGAGLVVGAGAAHVSGATITGNLYTEGGVPFPLDLLTVRKPKFAGTCDHSASFNRKTGELGPSWGVCAGD